MQFTTMILQLIRSLGDGEYGQLSCKDISGNIVKVHRWKLTSEQEKLLKQTPHFVRVEHRANRMFINKMIPIPRKSLVLIEKQLKILSAVKKM